MWKRILAVWSLYRHGAALKDLMQYLGLWGYVATTGAGIMSTLVAVLISLPIWGKLLVGLGTFALILLCVGLGVAVKRIGFDPRIATQAPLANEPSSKPLPSNADPETRSTLLEETTPVLRLQPSPDPIPVQGWKYYALQVYNEQWRTPKSFYGVRATLRFTPPAGSSVSIRGLFCDRAIDDDQVPRFTEELARLEPEQPSIDLVLAIRSGGDLRSEEKGIETLWTCSSYPPNITLETKITPGEWKCAVMLSWEGGRMNRPYNLSLRRYHNLRIEPITQPSEPTDG